MKNIYLFLNAFETALDYIYIPNEKKTTDTRLMSKPRFITLSMAKMKK